MNVVKFHKFLLTPLVATATRRREVLPLLVQSKSIIKRVYLLQVGDVDLVVLCKLLISVRCFPGNPAQYINGNRLYLSEIREIM